MRHLKKIFVLSLALIGLSSFTLNAQEIRVINPSNASASAAEIKDIFGARVHVAASAIKNFYQEQWSETGYSSGPHPKPSIQENNNNYIHFNWIDLPPPASNNFTISYLNLETGESTQYTTDLNNIKIPTSQGFYLFTFQSRLTNGRGGDLLNIIIERPISFYRYNHACGGTLFSIWEEDFSPTNNIAVYPWSLELQETPVEKEYMVTVNFDNWITTYAKVMVRFEYFDESENDEIAPIMIPESIWSDDAHQYGCSPNEGNTALMVYDPTQPEDVLGTVGFVVNPVEDSSDDPVLSFTLSEHSISRGYTGEVVLSRCMLEAQTTKKSEQLEDELVADKISFKEISGSFNPYKTFQYELPKDNQVAIALYNNYGELIQQVQSPKSTTAGLHQFSLNIQDVPHGFYFCVLKTKTETLVLKVIK